MLPTLLLALTTAASATPPYSVDVPVSYQAGRIIARPRTANGQTLHLWVDTGGGGANGLYVLTASTVQHLHLATIQLEVDKQSITLAALPDFAPGGGIPPPAGKYAKALVIPSFSTPVDPTHFDGMLGAGYLPGNPATHDRIWTFDYPGQHLTFQGVGWRPPTDARSTALHFPVDAQGHLAAGAGFARIIVHVDGKPLSLLLDTGATGFPTSAGAAAQGGTSSVRATSFITTSQLERWHKQHPQWRVVADADRQHIKGKAMRAIEVPFVDIAGWRDASVWFTERPDSNFHDFMSSMMDKRVEGALGGNAFDHFVMTVDYGHAKAWFRCFRDCTAAPTEEGRVKN